MGGSVRRRYFWVFSVFLPGSPQGGISKRR
nr:MAG TPA: hypothetical protein [Caudoviricetes sp.]